ncbi:hypothetical protein DFP81_1063 [Marinomonas pollencensis]|uniref:Uncharacterized protein n=1 Tax=Marinomonas pollencensis TaxID=491954 RepID=A0A3E0DM15_9GAMM|nr:hypothetical protein DFP81_1063 [Marinomonas pollencensis]
MHYLEPEKRFGLSSETRFLIKFGCWGNSADLTMPVILVLSMVCAVYSLYLFRDCYIPILIQGNESMSCQFFYY